MDMWKRILHRLLFPGTGVVILGILLSAVMLFVTFRSTHRDTPAAYLSYGVSAYTLTVVCAQFPKAVKRASALLHRDRHIHRYLTDVPFRTRISLYLSLGINLSYAVMKLSFGIYYRSFWFGTFGVYYVLLTVMRASLLRHARRNSLGAALILEWERCRLCGVVLIAMSIALSGVSLLLVEQEGARVYPGHLIYAVALYTFYAAITAVVGLVRYRRYRSPVMSSAKVISLTAALVSMLSLTAAMLTRFGSGEDPLFRLITIAATGAGVCAAVLGMSVFMIVRSSRMLKKLRSAAGAPSSIHPDSTR